MFKDNPGKRLNSSSSTIKKETYTIPLFTVWCQKPSHLPCPYHLSNCIMEILTCLLISPKAITNPTVYRIIVILLFREEKSPLHGLIKLKARSSLQDSFPGHGVRASGKKILISKWKKPKQNPIPFLFKFPRPPKISGQVWQHRSSSTG